MSSAKLLLLETFNFPSQDSMAINKFETCNKQAWALN